MQHKHSVARTLLDRAKNIPSTDEDKKSEVQHVVDALKKKLPRSNRGFVTLPYFQGISKKIARTLRQFDVNVAKKPFKTVGSILKKPKDKFDQDLSTGVVCNQRPL